MPARTSATYAITQGTLALSSNYDLSYVGDDLTINQAELKLNAVANSKTYGNADPTFGYTLGGFKFSDTATTSGSAASGAARAATRSSRQPGPIPTSSLACRTR